MRRLKFGAVQVALWLATVGVEPARASDCGPVTSHLVTDEAARWGDLGDIDGDGDIDVLAISSLGTRWYENKKGAAGDWAEFFIDDNSFAATLADLDGDGDLDLLNQGEWLENADGHGHAWILHDPPGYGSGVPADMDGDGDLDLLNAAYSDQLIYWLENVQGDGLSWTSHVIDEVLSGIDRPEEVQPGDVDGDGDLDVVALTGFGVTVSWFENEGLAGSWQEWTIELAPAGENRGLELADLDGDSDLDVVVTGPGSSKVRWFENSSGGQAWSTHLLFDDLEKPTLVAALDYDVDGDLDLLTGSGLFTGFEPRFLVHENVLGDASLWGLGVELPIEPDARSIAGIADIDGDFDPDVVLVHWLEAVHWYGALGVPATQVSRVGVPANPDVFRGSPDGGPRVGTVWSPFLEHGSFVPNPTLDFAILSLAPANLDLGLPGTLLCNTNFALVGLVSNPLPGSPFAIDVPPECAWMGVPFSVQGGSLDGQSGAHLANALDVVIGSL